MDHNPTYEMIEHLLETKQIENLRQLIAPLHPADIAEILDHLKGTDAVLLFNLLSIETASEVLDETGSLVRQNLVEQVDDEHLADLLDQLPMDDAVEFLEDLPDPVADRLLDLMEPEEAGEVRELLAYEEETAGRLMSFDIAKLRRQWTASEAIDYLRSLVDVETLHYLYVVDAADHLIGVLPLRALILAQAETIIETIMRRDVISISVNTDQEELAEFMSKYDFFSLPIVDEENKLVGVVTADDAFDVVEEEVTEDIQRLGGSSPLEHRYFATTTRDLVQKRVGWLLMLFLASMLTESVIRSYESMAALISLQLFIPLVTGTGGNAGSQTVNTIVRAIAIDEIHFADIGRALRREWAVAIAIGLILGVAGFIRAAVWQIELEVALVLALTLPLVVIWSTTIATIVPIVAERFKIDPTVVSGPMIATIVDASGLAIYFSLASWILG